jgi:hypothetical protein
MERYVMALVVVIGVGTLVTAGCGGGSEARDPAAEKAMRDLVTKKLADEANAAPGLHLEKIPPYPSVRFCNECRRYCGGPVDFCWCSCCTTCGD